MAKLNCDHVIDYLNGTLSKEEQLEFEQHLKTCTDCQEIIEMTGDLPYLADPVDPPAGMKARILSTVFEEEQKKSEEVKRGTRSAYHTKSGEKEE
ncbi:zf-HC2 domain-containing protein [Planococcus sp. 107-1]|uniref:zf-HC2 domain-containing protein n=1 Tax=Planococcus sp. 107-1 TaxID=2908840 RepID=UPI001F275384|nr:zf-HC2 domain-containing protein [Planococcus sp. 107-1]UJF26601.1 zf-HC2 domain-containing protein [Planococcus sp. 107-1]